MRGQARNKRPLDWLVTLCALPLLFSGCRYVLGLEAAPGSRACVRNDDCTVGHVCSDWVCVVDGRVSSAPLDDAGVDGAGDSSAISLPDDAPSGEEAEAQVSVAASCSRGCPSIVPARLPAPCRGNRYTFRQFGVLGGKGPYTWAAIATPPGMEFDPSTTTLSGVPWDSGQLSLEVTDQAGDKARVDLPFEPRRACWLAYTAEAGSAVAGLHLYDPILQERRSFFAPDGASAVDFKLSPNRRYIAYHARAANAPAELHLVDLESPAVAAQHAFELPGDVIDYAWSDSSGVLAVAYRTPEETRLGGFDVKDARPAAGLTGSDGAVDIAGIETLASAPAQISSPIVWFANDNVAFPTPFDSMVVPAYAHLTPGGFSVPQALAQTRYKAEVLMRRAGRGFFAVWTAGKFDYYNPDAGIFTAFYPGGVADGMGRYVARVQGGELNLYFTEPPGNVPVAGPWATAPGCGMLLAWASGMERIACVTDPARSADAGSSAGPLDARTVRIFDVKQSPAALVTLGPMGGTYAYSESAATGHRRSFSPSGRWLGFTDETSLWVARVTDGTPVIYTHIDTSNASVPSAPTPSELAFSPDETSLLWSRAGQLARVDLVDRDYSTSSLSTGLAGAAACEENFPSDPDDWCGAPPSAARVRWSSDSRLAAARNQDERLMVWEFISSLETAEHVACQNGCGEHFEFQ